MGTHVALLTIPWLTAAYLVAVAVVPDLWVSRSLLVLVGIDLVALGVAWLVATHRGHKNSVWLSKRRDDALQARR